MDTNIKPKVSIVICTYNRAHLIEKAIGSILTQTFSDWELLIIDDASKDNTEEVVKKYYQDDKRISYIRQPQNVGIARNRNTGIELSKGEYIAVLDSDDEWIDTNKLQKQIDFLESNKDHALIGTNIIIVDENGNKISQTNYDTKDSDIRNKILLVDQTAQSSVVYRKQIAVECGGYDGKYEIADDYDLWFKIGLKHQMANLPEITVKYLEHSNGISKAKRLKHATEHKKVIEVYKKDYPNYYPALLKAYLRIILAPIR